MPAVVSDSSPFVYLAALGRFELLRVLYAEVFIPPAVWNEVAVDGEGRVEADLLRNACSAGWVKVERITTSIPTELRKLDDGEREAIALAKEKHAILVIDEARGRNAAAKLGIQCTGTVGVLVEARLRGLVPLLRPELERLRSQSNFRFTESLFEAALLRAGEAID